MVFLKEVLFAPDTTRLSLEVRVRRVWLVGQQIRKQSFGSAKLGPRSQQGANERSGAPESGGGETARRGFWAGCRDRGRAEPVGGRGACPGREGACPGRGLRSAGAGRRRQSWIPEATDASVGSLRESVSRPRQVGDGMRPARE